VRIERAGNLDVAAGRGEDEIAAQGGHKDAAIANADLGLRSSRKIAEQGPLRTHVHRAARVESAESAVVDRDVGFGADDLLDREELLEPLRPDGEVGQMGGCGVGDRDCWSVLHDGTASEGACSASTDTALRRQQAPRGQAGVLLVRGTGVLDLLEAEVAAVLARAVRAALLAAAAAAAGLVRTCSEARLALGLLPLGHLASDLGAQASVQVRQAEVVDGLVLEGQVLKVVVPLPVERVDEEEVEGGLREHEAAV
jgi:hypothetical protein